MANRNPAVMLLIVAGLFCGFGLSMLEWGDADGVHGVGWPIPTEISGLSEDAPAIMKDLSDFGYLGVALNVLLALLAVFLLLAIIRLVLRITGR